MSVEHVSLVDHRQLLVTFIKLRKLVVIMYAVTDVACRLVALKIMELLRATNLVHQAFFTQMTARITHSFEFAGILQLLVSILIR
jgi:hypothetical protein